MDPPAPPTASTAPSGDGSALQDFYAKKDIVPKFWRDKYEAEANKFWDKFYQHNTTHFFKDRHWLTREFPELLRNEPTTLLEVGCGVGNTIFPLLEVNPHLTVVGIDFSAKAISLVKANASYSESRCRAFVCDVGQDPLPSDLPPLDLITMIFVLSAISPQRMPHAVKSLFHALKPGALVLFRDYAVNDGAHQKMKNRAQGEKKLGDNWYVRGDGTQVYYFTTEGLERLFRQAGFVPAGVDYVAKETVNHKEDVKMDRTFVQARFQKPLASG